MAVDMRQACVGTDADGRTAGPGAGQATGGGGATAVDDGFHTGEDSALQDGRRYHLTADREAFTREPPKTLKGRIGYLIRQLGSAPAVAQEIGVSPRSVERYRKGESKHPPQAIAERIDAAVRQR